MNRTFSLAAFTYFSIFLLFFSLPENTFARYPLKKTEGLFLPLKDSASVDLVGQKSGYSNYGRFQQDISHPETIRTSSKGVLRKFRISSSETPEVTLLLRRYVRNLRALLNARFGSFRSGFNFPGIGILPIDIGENCPPASIIFFGGPILTMAGNEVQAVAVRGNTIIFTGPLSVAREACWYRNSAEHNLNGQTLMPGFISSHSHFVGYGAVGPESDWVDVSAVNTHFRDPWNPVRAAIDNDNLDNENTVIGQLRKKLNELDANENSNTTWLKAFAFDPTRQFLTVNDTSFGNSTNFDKEFLNRVSSTRPIIVMNNSGHLAYVNDAALKALKICAPSSDATGCNPLPDPIANRALTTGVLQEEAVFLAEPFLRPPLATLPTLLKDSAMRFASQGYTTVNDAGPNKIDQLLLLDALVNPSNDLNKVSETRVFDPNFPLNIVAFPAGVECYDTKNNKCREYLLAQRALGRHKSLKTLPLVFGALKFWADGSPQAYTNAMINPYFMPLGNLGVTPCCEDNIRQGNEVTEVIKQATANNFQVAIHVNGNLSLNKTIDDLEAALGNQTDRRPQIIHLAFAMNSQMETLKKHGAVTTVLINDLYYWGGIECTTVFGPALMDGQNYPTQFAMDAGLSTSLHSDAPVTPPNPLWSIWVAVKRMPLSGPQPLGPPCASPLNPANRISIEDGLRAYTTEAAYQFFLEKEVGTLEVGKLADMVILSRNPLDIGGDGNIDELLGVEVKSSVSRGRLINEDFWDDYLAN